MDRQVGNETNWQVGTDLVGQVEIDTDWQVLGTYTDWLVGTDLVGQVEIDTDWQVGN
jgi:hypothetical protein